jgi:formylglycine-generating enzyme
MDSICTNCFSIVPALAKFCPKCGTPVGEDLKGFETNSSPKKSSAVHSVINNPKETSTLKRKRKSLAGKRNMKRSAKKQLGSGSQKKTVNSKTKTLGGGTTNIGVIIGIVILFSVISIIVLSIYFSKIAQESVDFSEHTVASSDKDNVEIDIPMVYVKGGTFFMGCLSNDKFDCTEDTQPAHKVMLDDYYIGKYEITVGQFNTFIKESEYITTAEEYGRASHWNGYETVYIDGLCWRTNIDGEDISDTHKDYPVTNISWNDADAFCKWLSEVTSEKYSLPTEAQWEFAAKGGADVLTGEKITEVSDSYVYNFAGGDNIDELGWYWDNRDKGVRVVGQKEPNQIGIYDMTGNVWEYSSDWYGDYTPELKRNPTGPKQGEYKTRRGGAWNSAKENCRVVSRSPAHPTNSMHGSGFRVVRNI